MDTSDSFWVYTPNSVYGLDFVCLSVAVPVTKAKWMPLGQFVSTNTICEDTMAMDPPQLDGLSRTGYNESIDPPQLDGLSRTGYNESYVTHVIDLSKTDDNESMNPPELDLIGDKESDALK